jgi:glycosyltransferase involved in cell wall biosynthesis
VLTKLELGGAQKVCLSLLEGVNQELSTSLMSGTQGPLVEQANKHKETFLLDSFKREVGIKTLFYELTTFYKMLRRMRKLKKKYQNLVVHTHSTKAGLMGRWAAFFARIKKRVHTVHGFGFHEHQSKIGYFINFILEYITSFITTHYVCVSMVDQNIGKKHLYKFLQKSSIIRAAVDYKRFYQPALLDKSSKKFIFGTVSCCKPQKNLIDLLKAFKEMNNSLSKEHQARIELHIIGDGGERPKLEKWLEEHNMKEKILMLGWQTDVARWMCKWNVFVMSSLWEGLPCAVVEARLSKLPVISYRIAGIPEVITDSKNGFLVDAGDWKTLGQRMQNLVENRATYDRMSVHQDNLFDFSNEVMIKKHISLYKNLFKNF